MNTKQLRAAFEAWALKERIAYRDRQYGVCFYNGQGNTYWIGYQAGRAAIEPYKDEVARLQRIIDSRPALNAGLPQTYIEWSHSIYQMEAARVLEVKQ